MTRPTTFDACIAKPEGPVRKFQPSLFESRDTRLRVSGSSNIVRSDTPGGVSLQRFFSFIEVCSQ